MLSNRLQRLRSKLVLRSWPELLFRWRVLPGGVRPTTKHAPYLVDGFLILLDSGRTVL